MDDLAPAPKKGVASCHKLRGGACIPTIRRSPNGNPAKSQKDLAGSNARERAERKHSSKRRKRKQFAIPLVTASERGTVQTESLLEIRAKCGVVDQFQWRVSLPEVRLESGAKEGDSPVGERKPPTRTGIRTRGHRMLLSNRENLLPRLNTSGDR